MSVKQVFNTSAELDYPTVLPTLDLDFANSKTLDPRITFERASGGSYVGADGLIKYAGVNEARFDHDPVTGESLGLLVEEQRSNLLNSSFSTAGTNCTISTDTSITAPDGSLTAQKVQSTVSSGNMYSSLSVVTNSSGSSKYYTWSVFVKEGYNESRIISAQFGGINRGVVRYFFDTDTFETPQTSYYNNPSRELYPNGWIRLHGVWEIPDGSTFNLIVVISSVENDGGTNAYFYQWGAQIEEGAFPTSYIPTQGSTRTRSADAARIGSNQFDWYNEEEGTLKSDYDYPYPIQSNFRRVSEFRDDTCDMYFSSQIVFPVGNAGIRPYFRNFEDTTNLNSGLLYSVPGEKLTSVLATDGYDTYAFVSNGSYGSILNTPLLKPRISNNISFRIGNGGGGLGGYYLNGHIYRITYWPKKLNQNELRLLSQQFDD